MTSAPTISLIRTRFPSLTLYEPLSRVNGSAPSNTLIPSISNEQICRENKEQELKYLEFSKNGIKQRWICRGFWRWKLLTFLSEGELEIRAQSLWLENKLFFSCYSTLLFCSFFLFLQSYLCVCSDFSF